MVICQENSAIDSFDYGWINHEPASYPSFIQSLCSGDDRGVLVINGMCVHEDTVRQ